MQLTWRHHKHFLPAALAATLFLGAVGSVTAAGTYYVKNARARLLSRPSLRGNGPALAPGTKVTRIAQQGLFYRVKTNGRTGWVARLYLSTSPRTGRVRMGFAVSRSKSQQVRTRASAYTQTAAARGLTKSESIRVRGAQHRYDFEAMTWLEAHDPSADSVEAFKKAGRLGRAR